MKVSMAIIGAILVVAVPLACGQKATAPAEGKDTNGVSGQPPRGYAPPKPVPPARPAAEDPEEVRVAQRPPALPGQPVTPQVSVEAGAVTLDYCLVSLIEEAEVPAEVPAIEGGKLLELKVKEGDLVKEGMVLAQIDGVRAELQQKAADAKLNVAQETAKSTIGVRYARAAAAVAKAEYDVAVETNRRVPNTVPAVEVQKLLLTANRAYLEIEQAELQERIDDLEVKVSEAELDAAKESIQRYQIISPMDAVVREVYKNRGEWVKPGEPVMHIQRIDKLRVEGLLNIASFHPSQIIGKPVTVTVALPPGQEAPPFKAKITFVEPSIQSAGDYAVWAEVDNSRTKTGQYVLFPGMNATMTIHMK